MTQALNLTKAGRLAEARDLIQGRLGSGSPSGSSSKMSHFTHSELPRPFQVHWPAHTAYRMPLSKPELHEVKHHPRVLGQAPLLLDQDLCYAWL